VAFSYVVDRMLAEFAAAAVNLSRAIDEPNMEGAGDDGDDESEGVSMSKFAGNIERIIKQSHSKLFPYYSSCLVSQHKHFTWTGPELIILHRSPDISTVFLLMTVGEEFDLLSHEIYSTKSAREPFLLPDILPLVGKHREQADHRNPSEEPPRKRKRKI
jgi:hypothetical protein